MLSKFTKRRSLQASELAIFTCNALFNFILANCIQHTHLFFKMINSITSSLIKFIFTSSRGVVKNPQFWAQFCCALASAFRRYFLKKKILECWTTFEKRFKYQPPPSRRCTGEILHSAVHTDRMILCQRERSARDGAVYQRGGRAPVAADLVLL